MIPKYTYRKQIRDHLQIHYRVLVSARRLDEYQRQIDRWYYAVNRPSPREAARMLAPLLARTLRSGGVDYEVV